MRHFFHAVEVKGEENGWSIIEALGGLGGRQNGGVGGNLIN